MKVVIHSNAPWAATGYGQQTALLCRQLVAAGHQVAVSAFYGLQNGVMHWNDVTVYPVGFDGYGNDSLPRHAAHFFGGDPRDGLVITLVDAWVLNPEMLSSLNTVCWVPVDHDPVPPAVVDVLEKSGVQVVAMSRFGQRALANEGIDAFYVPHSVDTQIVRPRSPEDRDQIRRNFSIPDGAFVVGMVAANKGNMPPRKGWAEAIEAFSVFARNEPRAFLHLHTEPHGLMHGINLLQLLEAYGVPGDRVRFSDVYYAQQLGFTPGMMADLFAAFDVLLNPSYGEGFGVPVLEAQAAGTPVIVTDCTAMSEVGDVGWHVPGRRVWTPQLSWMTAPDVPGIVEALTDAGKRAHRMRDAAVAHAAQYDVETVWREHWQPTLATLAERFAPIEVAA